MMNNMNQFGNNLNAPYGQNDYSQFFYGKNQYGQQQQQNMNNLLWVQGIEGAKAHMLPHKAKIICLESETENRAYIKVADELGATKLRKFDLIEVTDAETTSNDLSDYVRKDELQSLLSDIIHQEKEVIGNQPAVSTTQPAVTRRVIQ